MAQITETMIDRVLMELQTFNLYSDFEELGIKLVRENQSLWGSIRGPQGSPYEGGTFLILINLPDSYPLVPPEMRFRTKIWHPNINSESEVICHNILKRGWHPSFCVTTVLQYLQRLLSFPAPDDQGDHDAADQYLSDRLEFLKKAREWTKDHATYKDSTLEKLGGSDKEYKNYVIRAFHAGRAMVEDLKSKGDDKGKYQHKAALNSFEVKTWEWTSPQARDRDLARARKRGLVTDLTPELSFIEKFRKRGLVVTDFTATEWCEAKVKISLLGNDRQITTAMEKGKVIHEELAEEDRAEGDSKRVKGFSDGEHSRSSNVKKHLPEDYWAGVLMEFIEKTNILHLKSSVTEIPVFGFFGDVFVLGYIDKVECIKVPAMSIKLLEVKTTGLDKLPFGRQQLNGRMQLMCYKELWDQLVHGFPEQDFYSYLKLKPNYNLSKDNLDRASSFGFTGKTLHDLVCNLKEKCALLRHSETLKLRYLYQENVSRIDDKSVTFDSDLLKKQIGASLKFWHGDKDREVTPTPDLWKCKKCTCRSKCSTGQERKEKYNW